MKNGYAISILALSLTAVTALKAQLSFNIDYSKDTSGFFTGDNIGRQANLNAAASYLGTYLTHTSLTAITNDGVNSWTAKPFNPSDPTKELSISNLNIAANTFTVFAGGSSTLGADVLGVGGPGSYSYSSLGSPAFIANLGNRGTTSEMTWGGSISFASTEAWYFDSDINTVENMGENFDFFSVAVHELTHLIGFGTLSTWDILIDKKNKKFTGAASQALTGGPVSLSADIGHWIANTQSTSILGTTTTLMGPSLPKNTRYYMTALDQAGLQDIGFSQIPEPATYAALFGFFSIGFAGYRRKSRSR